MRIYIIGNDEITLPGGAPAAVNTARLPLPRGGTARRSAERQAAAGIVERSARCRKAEEGRRPGDREALIDELWSGH
jgi:hypothetical protein